MIFWISVGSNIKARYYFTKAAEAVLALGDSIKSSPCYVSKAIGRPEQGDYTNALWALSSSMGQEELAKNLKRIEGDCDRIRDPKDKFAARTMDLDLLGMDEQFYDKEEIVHREFIRQGLIYINQDLQDLFPAVSQNVQGEILSIDQDLSLALQRIFQQRVT